MKRLFIALSLLAPAFLRAGEEPVVAASTAAPAAEEEVFISLTRRAQSPARLPTNASRVTYRDLEVRGAATADEGLDLVPSVLVQKSGGLGTFSSLRLRGSPSSSHSQVVLDDLPLQGVSNQFFNTALLPAAEVERIEVVRGGAGVLYGPNTIGGVVHVITRRPTVPGTVTRVQGDFASYYSQIYSGELAQRGDRGDLLVNAGRYLTDGFQGNQDSDNIHASFKGGVSAESGLRVDADVSVLDTEVGNPKGTDLPVGRWDGKAERTPLDRFDRVETKSYRSHAGLFVPLGEASLRSTFYGSDHDFRNFHATTSATSYRTQDRILGNDTRLLWADRWTLGAMYERDVQQVDANAYGPETAHHIANVGAYGQGDIPAGSWSFLPGLRFDNHSVYGSEWNPRLTVVNRPAEGWKLSGNIARSFRAPNFSELFYQSDTFSPNPDLTPEHAWTYDVGVERGWAGDQALAVTGFYTRIRDRITSTKDPYPAVNKNVNAPSAEICGVEVEASHRLLTRWTGRLAYTYTRAVGNALDRSEYMPLRLTPRHMAAYQLDWRPNGGWELMNALRYVSKQFQYDGEQGLDLPPFARWDARVSKRILKAELYFGVDNLLDRRYSETVDGYYDPTLGPFGTFIDSRNPQPGRTYRVGATIAFQD